MIKDKHSRFYVFGESISEDKSTIISSLGFYEISLPSKLVLYHENQELGEYTLPPEVVGQTFEGLITSITLKKCN
jgi:hypothetical protein